MKIYCVVQRYYDNGKVCVNLETLEIEALPTNSSREYEKYDTYRDYFTDRAEADQFYKAALKA